MPSVAFGQYVSIVQLTGEIVPIPRKKKYKFTFVI